MSDASCHGMLFQDQEITVYCSASHLLHDILLRKIYRFIFIS